MNGAVGRRTLLLSALGLALQGCEGDPPPPENKLEAPTLQAEQGVLRLLGTGAMVPLARALAAAWHASPEGEVWRVEIEPSVGSGGGVRAVRDGVVDLGMISRPLSLRERDLPLTVTPVARNAVVLAVHQASRTAGMSVAQIEQLYAGEPVIVEGERLFLLLRDREESANVALERWIPSLKPLRERAYLERRARVLYHDEAMREALASTPGGVGVVDLGAVSAGGTLKGLKIEGVEPSLGSLRDGRWKATRELSFVHRQDRTPRVEAFLRFARSARGRGIIEAQGCLPLETP